MIRCSVDHSRGGRPLLVILGMAAAAFPLAALAETLYNGIQLPSGWPPRDGEKYIGKAPPYLSQPPAVIPIDVGRQLFVDDFLIQETTLERHFHQPEKYSGNPILKPTTKSERTGAIMPAVGGQNEQDTAACSFDDGVQYDSRDGLYKLWYMSGQLRDTALATSKDGLHWDRPNLDVVPGTNIVIPYDPTFVRDSFSPIIDEDAANPEERYKGYLYVRGSRSGEGGHLYTSPDGVHWKKRVTMLKGVAGDDTSIFYNPFRKKWGLSVRVSLDKYKRSRNYFETDDFLALGKMDKAGQVFWSRADEQSDPPDPTWIVQNPTQLYTLSPVAYESLMVGLLSIHYGPENPVCDRGNFPKLTQIKVAFSRDGFHWDRSDREIFIPATKKDGDWDRGYLRATGEGCVVVGDKLYFYYCGYSGHSDGHQGMYDGGSQHVAILRRDGFASMDAGPAEGVLTSRPVRFSGHNLYVNLNAPSGSLTAEVIDDQGKVIEPFSSANCAPLSVDGTRARVQWNNSADLGQLAGRTVRFRFHLTNGELYAFWVSRGENGESGGLLPSAAARDR